MKEDNSSIDPCVDKCWFCKQNDNVTNMVEEILCIDLINVLTNFYINTNDPVEAEQLLTELLKHKDSICNKSQNKVKPTYAHVLVMTLIALKILKGSVNKKKVNNEVKKYVILSLNKDAHRLLTWMRDVVWIYFDHSNIFHHS